MSTSAFGVQEMGAIEMTETDGGGLVLGIVIGIGIGIAVGYVYAKYVE